MLRLIDANLDRLSEGLRVIEDIARFVLNDSSTTEKLKTMRHELITTTPDLRSRMLAARDSEGDIGPEISLASGSDRESMVDLVTANAKRAQESLRVLEEFSKLPEMPSELRERGFEQARFKLYDIEKAINLRLTRQDRRAKISGLYVIIDTQMLAGHSETQAARQIVEGGASIIQLRDKQHNKRELVSIAGELRQICAEAGILFIVNDYIDIALTVDADGIHLGENDLPASMARDILPPDKIIGCSARTLEKAVRAQEEGADYIGVGSIYPSPTKPDAEVIGPEKLNKIASATSLPIVAIGGINEDNIDEVVRQGADSAAVISAVLQAEDVRAATARLATKIDTTSSKC